MRAAIGLRMNKQSFKKSVIRLLELSNFENFIRQTRGRQHEAQIEARRAEANVGNDYEMAAKLAGGLFTGAVTGKAVNPSTIVGTAALGTGEGLIAGAGLSEGTISDDPTKVATDALIGGVIGGVAGPLIGATANMAYRGLKPMAQRVAGWIKGTADDAAEGDSGATKKAPAFGKKRFGKSE